MLRYYISIFIAFILRDSICQLVLTIMYTQKVTVNLISATGDPSLCFNVIHKKWSGCTAHMLPEVIGADQTGFIQGG